jgi:hypothetical protein
LPFLTVDPEACLGSVLAMAEGGDDGKCSRSGIPGRDRCRTLSDRVRLGTSSSHALLPAR